MMIDYAVRAAVPFMCLLLINTISLASLADKDEQGLPYIVACVGDSLTTGNEIDNRVSSYPKLLQQQLGEKHYKVINGGTFGVADKKSSIVEIITNWVEQVTLAAKHGKPDIVVIQWGTISNYGAKRGSNWDPAEFIAGFITLIETVQKVQSHPTVFVCSPPPVYCTSPDCAFSVDPHLVNQVLPGVLSDIAHHTGSHFIDNFESLGGARLERPDAYFAPGKIDPPFWGKQTKPPYDGIHPNVVGNGLLADAVATEIVQRLHTFKETLSTFELHTVPVDLTATAAILARTHALRSRLKLADFYHHLNSGGAGAGGAAGNDGGGAATAGGGGGSVVSHPSPVATRPVIACIGDSITEGVGSRPGMSGQTDTMSFPAILQRMPGFHHFQILNFGKHGTRMSKSLESTTYWGSPEHALALTSHPHIVILQFGSNDVAIPEEWDEVAFRKDYSSMIRSFQALPSAPHVYICIPPPLYESDNGCDDSERQLRRCFFKFMLNSVLPGIIREIAQAEKNVFTIDNFSALGGVKLSRPDAVNPDHLHPTDLGYLAIAHEVAYTLSLHEDFSPIRPILRVRGGEGG